MKRTYLIFIAICIGNYAFAGLVWRERTITTATEFSGAASVYKGLEEQLESLPEEVKAQMGDISKLTKAKPETTFITTYLEKGMMKMIDENGETSITIIRGDKEVIWNIDPVKKTYTELTFDEMKKMMGMMQTQGAQVSDYKITPTNETKKIGGYFCKKAILTIPMMGETEEWLTEQIDMSQYTTGFEKMMTMSKFTNPNIKGFSMLTKSKGLLSEVTEVAEKKLSPTEFSLPSGLTKEKPQYESEEEEEE